MSGDNVNMYGDNVNMYGGTGNTGMVKNVGASPAPAMDPELRAALGELVHLVRELREQVTPATAQTIDETLPVLASADTAPPQERHRALLAVAGIAATAGALGVPVLDAVNRILQLLGG
ncbi:hypothetical protein ABZ354_23680 [Streptomyces sp. NPDC005925]|uniref:hypothetical protein n=1 Tax=Streptomyces sp. NPDC005925 TaxID=3157172 RepID=UPI0033FF3467